MHMHNMRQMQTAYCIHLSPLLQHTAVTSCMAAAHPKPTAPHEAHHRSCGLSVTCPAFEAPKAVGVPASCHYAAILAAGCGQPDDRGLALAFGAPLDTGAGCC